MLQTGDQLLEPMILKAIDLSGRSTPNEIRVLTALKLASTSEQIFEREKDNFLKLKDELLHNQAYLNKYVAIINGKVADSDNDKSVLVERIYANYGYIPVYVGQVAAEQKRYRRLPSPRRV